MQQWQCTVCGYIHTGDQPPEACPVCGADRSQFIALNSQGPRVSGPDKASTTPDGPQDRSDGRQWQCGVCGYVHQGAHAPAACPVCGADQDQYAAVRRFEPASAQEIEERPGPGAAPPNHRPSPAESTSAAVNPGRLEWILDKMVDLHAHPIAVHIPNGVLPIAVIFLLLGSLFHSRALLTASFYNLAFVALAMPAVLFSGYNDWQRRFGGRLTHVFLTKMICGAVILAGTWGGVIWRLFDSALVLPAAPGRGGYIVLHLIVLAAAIVAGYYGGKLVIFPKKPR